MRIKLNDLQIHVCLPPPPVLAILNIYYTLDKKMTTNRTKMNKKTKQHNRRGCITAEKQELVRVIIHSP